MYLSIYKSCTKVSSNIFGSNVPHYLLHFVIECHINIHFLSGIYANDDYKRYSTQDFWFNKTLNWSHSAEESGKVQIHLLYALLVAWICVFVYFSKYFKSFRKVFMIHRITYFWIMAKKRFGKSGRPTELGQRL